MSKTLKITIVTPGKESISYEAEALKTNMKYGQIEFRYNHTPIIISTIPTTTTIINGSKREELFTSSGIVYVKDNEVKFCCDAAEKSSDIDKDRALKSKERAEKRLKENKNIDIERAKRSLARANARISTLDINN
jgi:F-type H+-transporting ATPase subunit epsilon